jgi:hypothetical protein
MTGTLFSPNIPWNVEELKYNSILKYIKNELPGKY